MDKNGIGILKSLFYASQTVQGYGRLDRIPALYGLMWNTPRMMKSLQDRVAGKNGDSGNKIILLNFKDFYQANTKGRTKYVVSFKESFICFRRSFFFCKENHKINSFQITLRAKLSRD